MNRHSSGWDDGAGAIRYALGDSSLGSLLVAGTDQGICAIFMGDDDRALVGELTQRFSRQVASATGEASWLDAASALIDEPARPFRLALDLRGTAFQQRVWQALRDIPPGVTDTYAGLATRIGMPGAARAVGSACGANPIALAIPCHRVIRGDGGLGGYRWGLARKQALLRQEMRHADAPPLSVGVSSSPPGRPAGRSAANRIERQA
jgi:AraC family transcriptional regulator, regulatory protein of adaptative response / methylated-DNA-[protein]-cysteine methyltransferase